MLLNQEARARGRRVEAEGDRLRRVDEGRLACDNKRPAALEDVIINTMIVNS